MVERGEHLRFALEAGQSVSAVCERVGQDFDGDLAIQLAIAGAIHLAHPPGAEQADDLLES
jgi:hypothetical protein